MKVTTTDTDAAYVNVLVYGDAGVGKTVLCATAPKPLILNVEGGLLSLRGASLPVVNVNSIDDINEVWEYITVGKGKGKYKTICIDSLSWLAELILSEELGNTKDPRKAYGAMADMMATLVRSFRDLPVHVYATAKAVKVEDEASGGLVTMPSMPGKIMATSLPYYFDEVAHMFVTKNPRTKETMRRLRFTGTPRLIAKDRSGRLDEVEDANLTKLFDKMLSN